jgi:hypothetical protein
MKIIDIGVCVNNVDPKGIGRIRYRPYGVYLSEIEGGVTYEDWDENDPLIALPFLPAHINIIPKIQSSVKLIKYDTKKDTQNVEYVTGPFSSPHNYGNESFTSQNKYTTYGGVIVSDRKDLKNKEGKLLPPLTEGSFAKLNDISINGDYGSDVIFTENGVQIRGGALINKDAGNNSSFKQSLLDFPQVAKKMGRLNLKKFPSTMELVKEKVSTEVLATSRLKYVVEYEIDSFTNPTKLDFYIYKILEEYGSRFSSGTFGQNTSVNFNDAKVVKLINSDGTLSTPTHTKTISGATNDEKMKSIYVNLREVLHIIDMRGLGDLDPLFEPDDCHPFYYRPTESYLKTSPATDLGKNNKNLIKSKIQVRNRIGDNGLVYSRNSLYAPFITDVKTIEKLRKVKNSGEQSFSSLSSDKIYLLSTSPNVGVNVQSVNFNAINEYEVTQEDYLKTIDPNTYATVRGENLYNVLVAIKNLLDSHIHNINEPLAKGDENWIKLDDLMSTLRNDLLNDSIRIN